MKNRTWVFVAASVLGLAASAAQAGFAGQTILATLGPGSVVAGNTTGASDDNDGFTSGDHIFFIWDGGDDVYKLNWPGGDLDLSLFYNAPADDLDLFLYTPSSLDDSSDYGITNLSPDLVSLPGAAPGMYFIVIDSTAGAEGPYTLQVSPEPATLALLGAGGLLLRMRRKR